MQSAIESLAPSGHCGLVGGAKELTLNPRILSGRNLTFLTEGNSDPHHFIPRMIELWREGVLPLEKLVTVYSLDDINRAAQDASTGAVVKPVLIPNYPDRPLPNDANSRAGTRRE
jgi:aryl-alcohol dehydrogenase